MKRAEHDGTWLFDVVSSPRRFARWLEGYKDVGGAPTSEAGSNREAGEAAPPTTTEGAQR